MLLVKLIQEVNDADYIFYGISIIEENEWKLFVNKVKQYFSGNNEKEVWFGNEPHYYYSAEDVLSSFKVFNLSKEEEMVFKKYNITNFGHIYTVMNSFIW